MGSQADQVFAADKPVQPCRTARLPFSLNQAGSPPSRKPGVTRVSATGFL
jgi:hypothetical protein